MSEIGNGNGSNIACQICAVHIDVLHSNDSDQIMRAGRDRANKRKTRHLSRKRGRGHVGHIRRSRVHISGGLIGRVGLAVWKMVDPVNEIDRALLHFNEYPSQILTQYAQTDQLNTAQEQNNDHQ